ATMKDRLWVGLVSAGLGLAAGHAVVKRGENQLKSSVETMVGKCYIYRDHSSRLGGYFEKVVRSSPVAGTVTLKYTFTEEEKFKGKWACLAGSPCEEVSVIRFLDDHEEAVCPW